MQPTGAPILLNVAAAIDARGPIAQPAALLLAPAGPLGLTVLAAGRPADVAAHPSAAGAARDDRPGAVALPGLINAHAHLDLTDLGPRPLPEADQPGAFVRWIDGLRAARPTDSAGVARAVARGVALSRAAGVAAVGDIAGAVAGRPCTWATEALAAASLDGSGLAGTSFVEFFGLGRSESDMAALLGPVLEAARSGAATGRPGAGGSGVKVGLSPHAPYSVGRAGFAAAAAAAGAGWAVSSHVAESVEEHELLTEGAGPMREFLERLGLWSPAVAADVRRGRSAVLAVAAELLDPVMAPAGPVSLVHLNRCGDDDLDALADAAGRRALAAVVYCPRASDYFQAPARFGPHRYRDMLARGVSVALGTDSIVCLGPQAPDPARGLLGPLADMRLLWRRDGTDPLTLLAMATTHAALAIGLDPDLALFPRSPAPGRLAGLTLLPTGRASWSENAPGGSVGPLRAALEHDHPPEPVVGLAP